MKKLLLLGAMLIVGATSMADVIVDLGDGEGGKANGVGYLPIVSQGEVVNVKDKYFLRITPLSNIGSDGSSLLFNFGTLKSGDEKSLIGKFDVQVLKGGAKGEETPQTLSASTVKVGFNKGDATDTDITDPSGITSITSDIRLATNGDGQGGGATAPIIGNIDYTLTGNFEGKTKYIGNVQADIRIKADGTIDDDSKVGTFIDRTQMVAVSIKELVVTDLSPELP